MLYDKYAKKARTLVKVMNFFIKNKLPLIIGSASVFTMGTSYVSTKGMVIDETPCPVSIQYGEKLEYSAKGFLSKDIEYEYSLASSEEEWFSEEPTIPGKYNVRAISSKVSGNDSYGKIHSYTIEPKKVNVYVNESEIIYGENLTISADLAYEDSFVDYSFDYSDLSETATFVEANKNSLKVVDNKGNDITSYYEFTCISKAVSFAKREITITVGSDSKIYDGKVLNCNSYELSSGSMAFSDNVVGELTASIIDYGNKVNTTTFVVINNEGKEVTKNYNIKVVNGTLTVNKRPLYITTDTDSKTYDGESLSNQGYTITNDSSLVENHKFIIESSTSITNYGEAKNALTYKIVDTSDNNKDVTNNYAPFFTFGTLTINKREIEITSLNDKKEYDGTALTKEEYSISNGSLVEGHNINITYNNSIINEGNIDNTFSVTIADGNTDVSENYKVTSVYGELVVEKRKITITSNTNSKEYDGKEFLDESYKITSGSLANDQTLVYTQIDAPTNYGEYDNKFTYKINSIDNEVTSNYEISVVIGKLTITKREIEITTSSNSFVYDKENHSDETYKITSANQLVDGDRIIVDSNTEVKNVCNDVENKLVVNILKGESSNLDNYNISYLYGKLNVTAREIEITTNTSSRAYNAKAYYDEAYEITSELSLAKGDALNVLTHTEVTFVNDEKETNILTFELVDENKKDNSSNYKISYVYGEINVTKAKISIESDSDSKMYDATKLTCESYLITQGEIYEDDTIEITYKNSITNVGSIDNEYELSIINGENDVSYNYDITNSYGTLEVTKRKIEVTTTSDSKTYDGTELVNKTYSVTSEINLANDQIIEEEMNSTITNVGSVDNEIVVVIKDANDNEVTDNYDITTVLGTLEITKRAITLSSPSESKEYDGVALERNTYDITSGDVANLQVLTVTIDNSITNVGSIENDFTYIIKDADDTDVTSNYDITKDIGELEVTPIYLTITTSDDEKTYDGTPLSNTTFTITSGSVLAIENAVATEFNSIIEVGSDLNTFTLVIKNASNEDVTRNYSITFEYGTLKITARPITITTEGALKVYDGDPLENSNYSLLGTYALNQTATVEVIGTITDVGTKPNEYTIAIKDLAGNDVTSNYQITSVIGDLVVLPRELKITTDSYSGVYDGLDHYNSNYTITDGTLVTGWTISVESYPVLNDVGLEDNNIVFIIKDAAGNDRTAWYDIILNPGTIEVTKRNIEITSEGDSKVYDGVTLTNTNYSITSGTIADNQTLEVELNASITNVGYVSNAIEASIKNSDDFDVTNNYNITCICGTLEITSRPLSLKSEESSKVYDGVTLTNTNYSITSGTIADNQTLEVELNASITNVGYVSNTIEATIKDSLDNNVTSNYDITYDTGELTINARPITITTYSDSKVYDKTALTKDGYEISSGTLADNQTETVTVIGTITNFGEQDNLFTCVIKDADANDVTSNYDITSNCGKLTIQKREIYISTASASKVYDGTALYDYTYTITEGEIVTGDLLTVSMDVSITNVSNVDNTFTYTILDQNTSENMAFNYDVIPSYGKLEITPRPITVKTESDTKVYDGTALENTTYSITEGDYAPNQTGVITVTGTITNKGTVDNDCTIVIKDASENVVTSNYEITKDLGTLTITPRPITIKTESETKVYDGLPLTNTTYTITAGTYAPNQTGVITVTGTITNKGTVDNDFTIVIKDASENVVTSNYEITKDLGTLTITPRPLTVKTESETKVYDGTPLENTTYTITSGTYAPNQNGVITVTGTITNKGTVDNDFTIVITDVNDIDVTDNYEIIRDLGTLTITPRPLTVKTESETKVYDGLPLENTTYTITVGTYAPNQNGVITVTGTITNKGTVDNDFTIVITDANDIDVTDNYEITKDLGTLTITPRPLTVKTESETKVYDGLPLTNTTYTITAGTYAPNQNGVITVTGTITNKGSVPNDFTIVIKDASENVVTSNYEITKDLGTLTITPRVLTYETGSASKYYDGTPLTCIDYKLIDGELAPNQTIDAYTTGTITDPGEVNNDLYTKITDALGNDVTSNYNIIISSLGKLTVMRIKIVLESGSDSKTYDGTPLTCSKVNKTLGNVLKNHTLTFEATGSQTSVGESDNTISYSIVDSESNDYSMYYDVKCIEGTLKVNAILIKVQTGSASKEYDGTPLKCENYTLSSGTLLAGHTLNANYISSITMIGTVDNEVEFTVSDLSGNDFTDCYDIIASNGELIVTPIEIIVTTGSDSKVYDGEPLICVDNDYEKEKMLSNHKVIINNNGSQTEVGISANTAQVYIVDNNDYDVSEFYQLNLQFGSLKVTSEPGSSEDSDEYGGAGGGSGNLDDSGKLSKKGFGTGDGDGESAIFFYATSTASGTVYFKQRSYGEYEFDGWDYSPKYYDSLNAITNPMYLTSKAIENAGMNENEVTIEMVSTTLGYVTPYYISNGPENQPTDYIINPNFDSPYTVKYYNYDYTNNGVLDLKGTAYEDLEADYYAFVKDYYTKLPDSTKNGMLEIIKKNINEDSPTLISDVATYIQNVKPYNLNFEDFPDDVDMALYFINEAKDGICQHYATSAVCMYRALGIPARYCGGFVETMVAGKKVAVTGQKAHAWVEVYIKGMGWIQVEVTGRYAGGSGGSGGSGGDSESGESEQKTSISIKPIDVVKEYDGTAHEAEASIDENSSEKVKKMISQGYEFIIEVSGSQTEVGSSKSTITSYKILDPDGEDMTENYDVTCLKGDITVVGKLLDIYIYSYSKTYDGTPLMYTNSDCYIDLPDGYTASYTLVGQIDTVGIREGQIANLKISDEHGVDVTDSFYINTYKGYLIIETIEITVTSATASRTYDGTEFTCHEYEITKGSLLSGHSMQVTFSGSIIDIGTEKNEIESIKIVDSSGNDVTKLYSIDKQIGKLIITSD